MLSLKTIPHLHHRLRSSPVKSLVSPFPPPSTTAHISLPSRRPKPFPILSLPLYSTTSPTSMDPTATTTANTTVEHVVLFKVRDATDQSKIDAMISNLRSLASLDIATHLTAGPILRLRSAAASSFGFTHLLHSRYTSKPDLAAYASHPSHVAVVKENVLPICDDLTAVDWVADAHFPSPPPGSALRLTLAKPKEAAATAEILAAIDGIKGLPAAARAQQLSFGENFSPARAKGFTVGFISVFPSVEELDAMAEDTDLTEAQKEKVRPLIDSLIVLDYVVPSSQTIASL